MKKFAKKFLVLSGVFLVVLIGATALSGGNEESDLPPISDQAVNETVMAFGEDEVIRDMFIRTDEDEITIAMILTASTNDELAQHLLDNARRHLDNLHEEDLWDHYTLNVMAGPSQDSVQVQGAMVPNAEQISW